MVSVSSKDFIYKTFHDFYTSDTFFPPSISRFNEREIGFFLLKNRIMIRHKRFQTIEDLTSFFKNNVPSDVYRSCAYYEYPAAEMAKKGWIGSDLVFDIDADHISNSCDKIHDKWFCLICGFQGKGVTPKECPLCGGKKLNNKTWPCESCLDSAKEETKKLISFLELDFGFSKTELRTFFSGHRGYHVHVENSAVETLDTLARKEIADYITGVGVMGKGTKKDHRDLPLSNFGWDKRLKEGLCAFLSEATKKDLEIAGITTNRDAILTKKELILERCVIKGKWDGIFGLKDGTWSQLLRHVKSIESSQIDTVVTTDVHRLIRMNNTLHGKTGFKKVEFPVKLIDSFDPFKEAVAFNGGNVRVCVSDAPLFRIGENMFGPYKNQEVELSIAAAVLLICKERAELVKNKNV